MAYQVDYIGVGQHSSCGDAISVRYWTEDTLQQQKIFVIDGGTLESGNALVDHIISNYGTNKVDYLFSTHLDNDHLSGLRPILERLDVETLYMHLPWEHADSTSALYKGNLTREELESKLQKSLEKVYEVQMIAVEQGTSIEEVFAGDAIGDNIVVLGPSKKYYEYLTSQFRDTPVSKSNLQEMARRFTRIHEKITDQLPNWIFDRLDIDLLGNNGETSAENNSSLVLLFHIGGHKILFTGDAGIPALTAAADFSESYGIFLNDLNFFDVPHHGSKHNIGSSILKRIKADAAIISTAKECTDHPSKIVTNALYKNGTNSNNTAGKHLLHHYEAPRPGWNFIPALPFFDKFLE